jgi:hypothetical protein
MVSISSLVTTAYTSNVSQQLAYMLMDLQMEDKNNQFRSPPLCLSQFRIPGFL